MKYYKIAIAIGILSIICISSSFSYYRSTQLQSVYNQKKYQSILKMRSERKMYGDKIEALKDYGKKLIAVSKDRKTNVDYDITLYDHDIDTIRSKIISTYSEGVFFLESATLESGSPGIRLAVKGFKMGENSDEN
jgi:lipopolysaccharide export LptBFGC system permease protein LptF